MGLSEVGHSYVHYLYHNLRRFPMLRVNSYSRDPELRNLRGACSCSRLPPRHDNVLQRCHGLFKSLRKAASVLVHCTDAYRPPGLRLLL